jgi:hypothetical protein
MTVSAESVLAPPAKETATGFGPVAGDHVGTKEKNI